MNGQYLIGSLNGLSSSSADTYAAGSPAGFALKFSHGLFFAPKRRRSRSDGPCRFLYGFARSRSVSPRCASGSVSGPPRIDAWKKWGWPDAARRGGDDGRAVAPPPGTRPGVVADIGRRPGLARRALLGRADSVPRLP